MSEESRLCYHAVPRIMKTDVTWMNNFEEENVAQTEKEVVSGLEFNSCKKRRLTITSDSENDDGFEQNIWDIITDYEQWKPFFEYISDCRINMNVRQVLDHGEQSLNV